MVTLQSMTQDLRTLGLRAGDSVLIHSSFKSLGPVEGGADTVVKAFQNAVGETGTVVFPTLCQEDWEHVYENWHLDAPSDVGYLTNYFRKLPGALRSDQATHSVAALGKDAAYITQTHGITGRRYGIFGDTPFAADSPWEKMYEMDTKVVFLGASMNSCTFRHYVEYCFMEKVINLIRPRPDFQELLSQIWCYERFFEEGIWPDICNDTVKEIMEQKGMVSHATCGNAQMLMISAKEYCSVSMDLLKSRHPKILWCNDALRDKIFSWLDQTGIFEN